METIKIPQPVFDSIENQCNYIPDGVIKKILVFNKKEYVITGSIGAGNGKSSWAKHSGHEVVDIEKYQGNLKPLPYWEALDERYRGNRPVGYKGTKAMFEKRVLVFIGDLIGFESNNIGKQLELF